MAYKILIPCDIAAAGKDYLRNKGYEIIMRTSNSIEDMCRKIFDCDAIIARHGKYKIYRGRFGSRSQTQGFEQTWRWIG
jgi:16S rRNA G1207 methylase RsmC